MLLGFFTRRRAARAEQELMAAVPGPEARDLAYFLYGHCSVSSHAPSSFEYASRAWLALGELRLPRNAHPLPDEVWQRMPEPLCATEFDWDDETTVDWDDDDPDFP